MKKFIGFYRDCDLLTMSGTFMALLGCILSINGSKVIPIFCLIIAGICDAFDGKLARRRKSSEMQSVYGVQLDSLSDLISFGVFPLVYTINILPKNYYFGWFALMFYSLCGMIRLAYFNTLDICKEANKEYFVGMPITSIAIFYPIVYLFLWLIKFRFYPEIISIFMILVGLSFISTIKIKKLNDKKKIILSIVGILFIIIFLVFYYFCKI